MKFYVTILAIASAVSLGLFSLAAVNTGTDASKPAATPTPVATPVATSTPVAADEKMPATPVADTATAPVVEAAKIQPAMPVCANHKIKQASIKQKTEIYELDVRYAKTGLKTLDDAAKKFANSQIKEFKEAVKFIEELRATEEVSYSGDLTIRNKSICTGDDKILNSFYTIESFTGGAHPNEVHKTFVYDIENDKILALADLFKADSKYMDAIIKYCMENEALSLSGGDSMDISEEDAKKAENFENFMLGDESITFIFSPYMVGPYVAGTLYIDIPLSIFEGMMA